MTTVYAFGPQRLLTTLQGGAVATCDDDLAHRFRSIRSSYGVREARRVKATCMMGGLIWAAGIASACSPAALDLLDNLTTRYMLPLGGLSIALAAGWFLSRSDRDRGFEALGPRVRLLAAAFHVTIRYITPALVLLVILWKSGLIAG